MVVSSWGSELKSGQDFDPGQGTKILHTMWCGQKKKKEMVLVDADGRH